MAFGGAATERPPRPHAALIGGCLSGPGVAGPGPGRTAASPRLSKAIRYLGALGQSLDRRQVDPRRTR